MKTKSIIVITLFVLLSGANDTIAAGPKGKILHISGAQIAVFDTETRQRTLVPGTTIPNLAQPTWSPDGEWFSFSSGASSVSKIYKARPDGSTLVALTSGGNNFVDPDWCPCGGKIAFQRASGGSACSVNVDGSGLTILPVRLSFLRWSPNGGKLLGSTWAVAGYDSDLVLYDITSGLSTTLTTPGAGRAYIRSNWSPDGQRIVAGKLNRITSVGDVITMNADGSGEVNLTAAMPASYESDPTWSPDGQWILFMSNAAGNWDIWAMKPDGSNRVNLTQSPENEIGPPDFFPSPKTPCELIEDLMLAIEAADLPKNKQPLLVSLLAACESIERGNTNAAVNQLEAFQNKVLAQVARQHAALAEAWILAAQAIIDELEKVAPPLGMALIPAGSFLMGETFAGADYGQTPVHLVDVSAFYMDKHEVTKALWDEVKAWSLGDGYSYASAGLGKATNHPVHTVSWYDVVKWCNARSQQEGLVPCYYTDAGLTAVYKTGQVVPQVNWTANGYRLPTEAEWEKAARGGASGHRFPWIDADTIQHSRANYRSSASYGYDTSPTRGFHPSFIDGVSPYTSPVGFFAPNGYGLYDMAGNIWEWCWDWWDTSWYGNVSATQPDPKGPSGPLVHRIMRGGSWEGYAYGTRNADRGYKSPAQAENYFGFRCVRADVPPNSPGKAVRLNP